MKKFLKYLNNKFFPLLLMLSLWTIGRFEKFSSGIWKFVAHFLQGPITSDHFLVKFDSYFANRKFLRYFCCENGLEWTSSPSEKHGISIVDL